MAQNKLKQPDQVGGEALGDTGQLLVNAARSIEAFETQLEHSRTLARSLRERLGELLSSKANRLATK
jgi:hypothetical protein